MKLKTLFFTVLLITAFVAPAATTPTNTPPATVSGVTLAKDARTLVIRYELSGQAHEQSVAFTNEITDFRYCRWLGEQGIAVVASTRTDEFYYAAIYLTERAAPVSPLKIPAPAGKSRLLGIANTGGDSLVISAVQHRRDGATDRLSGWLFVDNCPPIGAVMRIVAPFDLSVAPPARAK